MLNSIAGLLLSVCSVYSPPVDYDMTLAGTFGEPRPNHFHCGIDIKTAGVEGKRIYAVSDGYVSRITVGLAGFGNALYITHPDGYTSVYCHLKDFSPRVRKLLGKWQYAHESYTADVRLGPLDCPVARGQLVAISGNTGASQAPHLHFELHDTRTKRLVDPLEVLGKFITDGQAPMAHAFMAYPLAGEGTFCGSSGKQSFGFSSHRLNRRFTAWGKVGFGIWANDYMEATYNRYGVRETVLRVDGHEVFRSCQDEIPQGANRQVNFWGDYDHYLKYGVWYMRSFVLPGCTLPFLHTDANRGIVTFDEERDYHVEYVLSDFFGNTSQYEFTVMGQREEIPVVDRRESRMLMKCRRLSVFSEPGVWLVLPEGALPDDIELSPVTVSRPDAVSPQYAFLRKPFPLAVSSELGIALRKDVKDVTKLYVMSNDGRYCGGRYENGWIVTRIKELGVAYGLEYDDIPPVITPIGRDGWNGSQVIRIGISDRQSGLKSFHGYIDGMFVLFERIDKTPWVMCRLRETPIARTGQTRKLRFTVTDNCNNTRVFEDNIVY